MGIERLARRPVEAVARSSREVVAAEIERVIEGLLAGTLPEAATRAVIEQRVLERVAAAALETPDGAPSDERVERLVEQVLADERVGRAAELLAQRVVASPAFEQTLAKVLASPQVRRAAERQAAGFGNELREALRRRADAWDDAAEAGARRIAFQRPAPERRRAYGGVASRGIALVVDAALAQLVFLLGAASLALVLSLLSRTLPEAVSAALLGAGWTIVVICYFVGFWSTAAQTPGMRLLGLRIRTYDGGVPSVPRSFLRLVALLAGIALLLLGAVPILFDGRRRALQDLVAGTIVLGDDPIGETV